MKLEIIQNKIYELRGHRVMLDFDSAEIGIENKYFKRAVRNNIERYIEDAFSDYSEDTKNFSFLVS